MSVAAWVMVIGTYIFLTIMLAFTFETSPYRREIKGDARIAFGFFIGLVWPATLLVVAVWLLMIGARESVGFFRTVGRGIRDLYRMVRPKKLKSNLPRATARKAS